ncbi:3-isopropylmalate dehydratase large subunit [Salinarimonas sp. NSM]|uniref:3-isopropylmalate dehydratase large subunit n=1 Tax=Salinarimonas sp. NSM TaxID=3458003 RepID=UPI004035AB23
MADTYLDRLWEMHVVDRLEDGVDLIHVDRHLVHDLHCALAFSTLEAAGRRVLHPELTFAVADHLVSTRPGRTGTTVPRAEALLDDMERFTRRWGVRLFGVDDGDHGIIHIVGAEQGLVLPGLTVLACDSHACTAGALGALAWGIGTSETEHILATQTIRAEKPRLMRVELDGALPPGIGAKDLILHLIGRIGAGGGRGFAIEFDGSALRALSVEDRMTLCNMTMECGAEIALIRPDDAVFAYLHGRPYAPSGPPWEAALTHWRALAQGCSTDADRLVRIDASALAPQMTWGTNPAQVIGLDESVPDPDASPDSRQRQQMRRALDYMGLRAGERLVGLPIEHVFIGSCTNARIDDLRRAARLVEGRRIAAGVRAVVVPGSRAIRAKAEAEGLAEIFLSAGFEWHEAGCSMCAAINGDLVEPGQRCVSTSNRNFEGRQGLRARTHLASPELAAAAAVEGRIVNPWGP